MKRKMLIDAKHAEETRVAILDGDRLEEFDYESQNRKPLKGNIFLAKVTRVEPSLQAAFVNFGGNRHGFLPFSEIHPDYFRIPVSDREALKAEQEEEMQKIEEEQEEEAEADDDAQDTIDAESDAEDDTDASEASDAEAEDEDEDEGEDSRDSEEKSQQRGGRGRARGRNNNRGRGRGGRGRRSGHRSDQVEILGGTEYDDEEGNDRFRYNLRRKYKIQEVIKRGQIMLVQVSREERGNKGAAVSSYLSLPGRYCVLMPNSPRAGGVSRKISNHKDRNKMRDIMKQLETPKGMSVIVRTAGVERSKTEIKRDLDYLMRLWNTIREETLKSSAPALIYEEADLIKRAVRDLYTRDIEEIQVEGEEGFKTAKTFMKLMIPSHAKRVQEYTDPKLPIFQKYGAESKISEITSPEARLKSGGYLVINPTEALVSIDVNSGRATKERHIEETALNTNLEAAEEVARQLRLRDLGGLVVIDFIDMEDRRNNARVERKLKEALSSDRARIQIGRISSFGLLEMSRQRMNPSLTEAQFELCQACNGVGRIRSADGTSIMLLRAIEEEGIKERAAELIVHVSDTVALYVLNHKRAHLSEIEERYGLRILLRVDEDCTQDTFRIEVSKPADDSGESDETDDERSDDNNRDSRDDRSEKSGSNNRRRGRRGGRRRNQNRSDDDNDNSNADNDNSDAQNKTEDQPEEKSKEEGDKPKRRRRSAKKSDDSDNVVEEKADKPSSEDTKEDAPKKKPARGRKKKEEASDDKAAVKAAEKKTEKSKGKPEKKSEEKSDAKSEEKSEEKPKRGRKKKAPEPANESSKGQDEQPVAREYETVNEAPKKPKKGWWNKLVD